MYDEPLIEPKELIDRRSPRRLRPGSPLRALGAAVPALGAVFWFSALLGVGPMDGQEFAGLLVTIVSFGLWLVTLGRTVVPR
jgi:hypothetical protein